MPSHWSRDELEVIAAADELKVASESPAGTAPPYTTIWVVRVGDDLFARSYRGPRGGWYRAARRSGKGRVRAGGIEREVTFEEPAGTEAAAVDDAYRAKYGRSSYVDAMVTADAAATTLRLVPR